MPDQCRSDAVALLKADHRKVEDLFAKFPGRGQEAAAGPGDLHRTQRPYGDGAGNLYPACKGKVEEMLLNEAYVEHDGAKVLIAQLLVSAPSEEFYDAKIKVLSEQIEHHVDEEKRTDGMFSQIRAAGLDMAALGGRMNARKEVLPAGFKANGLPWPETRAFTGRMLEQGEPIKGRRRFELLPGMLV
jgi:hypothetical protein